MKGQKDATIKYHVQGVIIDVDGAKRPFGRTIEIENPPRRMASLEIIVRMKLLRLFEDAKKITALRIKKV